MLMKIMVTGGAGLIGIELCNQLAQMGHEVHLFDLGEQIQRVKEAVLEGVKVYYGSVVDLSSLRAAMTGCDVVIHLAALLGVRRSERDKLRCLEINIDGTKNILDCAVQHRVGKIVFASSSEVYGEPLENPITEDSITQGKTVYAVTKLAGEELCKAYAQKYPIEYSILRYFNCYGPYQTAQFVIAKFIRNVMRGLPPVIQGDGSQVRSYTYVTDTARATAAAALSEKANGQILNVGSGDSPISLKDLARLIIRIGGREGELQVQYRKNFENCDRRAEREIFQRYCNSRKAQELLSWRPEITIEEGIRKVFEAGVIFDRWENLYDEQT